MFEFRQRTFLDCHFERLCRTYEYCLLSSDDGLNLEKRRLAEHGTLVDDCFHSLGLSHRLGLSDERVGQFGIRLPK